MKELLSKLSKSYVIDSQGEGISFSLNSKSGYYCELNIGPESLEWYVFVKEDVTNVQVFTEWFDYQGYDNTSESRLIQTKEDDILNFIKNWESAKQIRISKVEKYLGLIKKAYCELLIDQNWIRL